jgi:hypothetical protein
MPTLLITPLSSEIGAGENWCCQITLAGGGTPWDPMDGSTTGPFNVSAGFIVNQNISSGGIEATLYGQAPAYPGVVTITDTINNITNTINVVPAIMPRSGSTKIYVGYGGFPDVQAPIVFTSIGDDDVYGNRVYQYQVIAHCVNATSDGGTTGGDLGIIPGIPWPDVQYTPFQNLGAASTVPTADGNTTYLNQLQRASESTPILFVPLGLKITSIYNSAQPDSDNPVTVTWQAHSSATSFDIIRQELYCESGDSTGWQLAANIPASEITNGVGVYLDTNATLSIPYTIPAINTTANAVFASDTNNGLSPTTAFATVGAARTAAASYPSSQIIVNGLVAAGSDVTAVNNVVHSGFSGDNTVDIIKYYGASSGTNVAIQIGNGCDYINLGLETDDPNQIVIGSNPADPAYVDTRFFGCRVEGWMNALRVEPSTGISCIKSYRSTFRSCHGACGALAPCCLYFSNCVICAMCSTFVQGKGTLPIQWTSGHLCLRDCTVESRIDSQSMTFLAITVFSAEYPWTSAAIWAAGVAAARSMVLYNTRLFGATSDVLLFGVLNGSGGNLTTGWWAYNSPLSKSKNAWAIGTLGSLYQEFNNGQYQIDPVIVRSNPV